MVELDLKTPEQIDVSIIGGGPAGLAAATMLKRRGVANVVVIEREAQAGGIPRHCGHPPFGLREFKRILTGPQYAKKLVETALDAGVDLRTATTVIEARKGGQLLIANAQGVKIIIARRVIYATGVRESPRSARLISGHRPLGILNTGALQSMVYLKARRPFKRPVIIGSELVAFSAIKTCLHANIRPVAIIESAKRMTARWPVPLYARITRTPIYLETRLVNIEGRGRVQAVEIEDQSGQRRKIACDGVLLTGQFTPESTLARCGHLDIDPASGGPLVDQYGRCSDPVYFAAGNVLRSVETAGWSWNEGRRTGIRVADDLAGILPARGEVLSVFSTDPLIKYVMPQIISLPHTSPGMQNLQLRFSTCAKGDLIAYAGGGVIWRKRLRVFPERRVLVPLEKLARAGKGGQIELKFDGAAV